MERRRMAQQSKREYLESRLSGDRSGVAFRRLGAGRVSLYAGCRRHSDSWVERHAVLGKGRHGIVAALRAMAGRLSFPLRR